MPANWYTLKNILDEKSRKGDRRANTKNMSTLTHAENKKRKNRRNGR